jgi:hypothetical protein
MAGSSLLRRSFTTQGIAPDRSSFAAYVGLGAALSTELGGGLYAALDGEAQTYFFRQQSSATGQVSLVTVFSGRFGLILGKRF